MFGRDVLRERAPIVGMHEIAETDAGPPGDRAPCADQRRMTIEVALCQGDLAEVAHHDHEPTCVARVDEHLKPLAPTFRRLAEVADLQGDHAEREEIPPDVKLILGRPVLLVGLHRIATCPEQLLVAAVLPLREHRAQGPRGAGDAAAVPHLAIPGDALIQEALSLSVAVCVRHKECE